MVAGRDAGRRSFGGSSSSDNIAAVLTGRVVGAVVTTTGATAVITYDHHIAVVLVGAAYAMGLRIPDDFSLVCFNDVFPVALLPPPLTAVAVSGREMGRIGADLLLNTVLAPAATVRQRTIRVPEDLVVRASTGPVPHAGEKTRPAK